MDKITIERETLESVKLSSNRRTSLNDIGGKAHEMASAVREQYLTPTPPTKEPI